MSEYYVRVGGMRYIEKNIKKIGCLGFSANPPHLGHLGIAQFLLREKIVDEVWLIPCFAHAFDKNLAAAEYRWQMAKFLASEKIKVSDIEIARKGRSYAIDTVRELRAAYPAYQFFWILGSDIVKTKEYLKWKDWEKLYRMANFIIINRPGFNVHAAESPEGFIFGSDSKINISSTEVRRRILLGLPVKGLVPPKVENYMKKHKLYQDKNTTKGGKVDAYPFLEEHPQALVIHCCDYRFQEAFREFIRKKLGAEKNYDLFVFPGSVQALVSKKKLPEFADVFWRAAEFLIKAHHISRIIIITHEDCGWYKKFVPLYVTAKTDARTQQMEDLAEAKSLLAKQLNGVTIELYYASISKDKKVVFLDAD